MQKKLSVFIFFSYNLPAGTLSLVLKFIFLLKFCVRILSCKYNFSLLKPLRKGKDLELESDQDLRLMDPDSEDPKHADPDRQH
jgi:hypothetical protein